MFFVVESKILEFQFACFRSHKTIRIQTHFLQWVNALIINYRNSNFVAGFG